MATSVPVMLWIIASRPSSSIRPTKTSRSLTTPCFWRRTIQEVVRTRSDVQNGTSTSMSSRFDRAGEAFAIR